MADTPGIPRRNHRRRPDRIARQVDDAIEYLKHFDEQTIRELLRRNEESSEIDGYGRGSSGESRSSIGDHSDPTLAAVQARAEDTHADPLSVAVNRIFDVLDELVNLAKEAHRKRMVVLLAADRRRGRESSLQGNCLVCGDAVSGVGEDRLRRGYDPKCYLSWTRWRITHPPSGDPGFDHQRFSAWRKSQMTKPDWRIGEIDHLQERGELPWRSA